MWWFNKKVSSLPAATGPYSPGCVDLMTGYTDDGLFLRLYYPTDNKDSRETNYKKWIPWIPDDGYVIGIANVIMIPIFILRLLLFWKGNIHIPVLYGEKIKTTEKLKCIVLSHGLGGHRFLYSNFCYEMASHGFLVAAVEHRDSSASNTYYYKSKSDAMKNYRTEIPHRHIELGKKHYEMRNQQVHRRSEECIKVLELLEDLNRGNLPYNVLQDVPGYHKTDFSLNDMVGNLDMDTITMAGHSFGGATALATLAKRADLKQGILLDPWMFPIKDEHLETKIEQPLLFINTQTFHIVSNVTVMDKFLKADKNRKMYTILHTTHENQTDSVLLIGYWLNWFMKKINPVNALKINHSLSLKFLSEIIKHPSDTNEIEKVLKEEKHNISAGLTKPWA